jgi:bifunctional non-homologous end joining protein LigD
MIQPMLSKLSEVLPSGKDYIYEIKLDGQRTIAEVNKKGILLYTRNFQDVTGKYPELLELPGCLKKRNVILDGEIVALENGIPSFELLQQRMNLRDLRALKIALEQVPVLYYVFDILAIDGKSLLKTPLIERKKLLQKILKPCDTVKNLPHFESKDLIVAKAKQFGYEGVVAKKRNSCYFPGFRSDCWIKYKFQQMDSFVIGGWMEGGRTLKFGSLIVGKYEGKKLLHCGRVGTGFDEPQIRALMRVFAKMNANRSPFESVPAIPEIVHWLKPRLVAEVKFKQWTRARSVRAPVFVGLRTDLTPSDCCF